MQRRLRVLPFALGAGLAAVTAAAIPLLATGATPTTMIQYTKQTSAKLPGIFSLFGHPKPTSETTTVSSTRERVDSGDTSQIIECDLKRVIHLDNNAKTYYVVTFDQMRAMMQAAMNQAQHAMANYSPPPSGTPPPVHGSGSFTLSVNTVNDPNTQTMFGMTAHHMTTTITGTANGSGDCPSGTLSMSMDEWYVPNIVKFSCPLPRPPFQMPTMPGQQGHAAQSACMSRFNVEASGKAHSGDHFTLKSDTTMNLGFNITTHEEVTQFQQLPYNASAFAVPAGYTQVTPPPYMNPSGH